MPITITTQNHLLLAQEGGGDSHSSTGQTGASQTGTGQTGTGQTGAGMTNTETGVAHDGGHETAFPPFDPSLFASQLLWLAITFGLFYWLMARVAIPRIAGILEVRRDRISGDLDEAQRMREEADIAHAAYEQELAEARGRAHAIAQEAYDKAKAEADAERAKVEADLAGKLDEAEAHIADIRAKALGDVGNIASETAGAIVKELIGGTVAKAELTSAVKAAEEQG